MKMKVKITFLEELLATSSANAQILTDYISKKASDENLQEEVACLSNVEKLDKLEEKGTTVFVRDNDGAICILNHMIKGFLKHAGNVIRKTTPEQASPGKTKKWGAIAGKIDDFVKITPRRIRLNCKLEENTYERSLRAMTAQGERVSLARSEYIQEGNSIEFEIHVYPGAPITEEMLKTMLDYGSWVGLGQWRNSGKGSFSYEILEINN
mgnify:FL=1